MVHTHTHTQTSTPSLSLLRQRLLSCLCSMYCSSANASSATSSMWVGSCVLFVVIYIFNFFTPPPYILCLYLSGIQVLLHWLWEQEDKRGSSSLCFHVRSHFFSTWLAFHHTACGVDEEATGSGNWGWMEGTGVQAWDLTAGNHWA